MLAIDLLTLLLWLAGAGLAGGLVNALTEVEGLALPRREVLPNGSQILRLGFVGNLVFGVLAAVLLAALYSPLAAMDIAAPAAGQRYSLTFLTLAGAFLSGVGGARIITNEANRRIEKASKEELAEALQGILEKISRDRGKED